MQGKIKDSAISVLGAYGAKDKTCSQEDLSLAGPLPEPLDLITNDGLQKASNPGQCSRLSASTFKV